MKLLGNMQLLRSMMVAACMVVCVGVFGGCERETLGPTQEPNVPEQEEADGPATPGADGDGGTTEPGAGETEEALVLLLLVGGDTLRATIDDHAAGRDLLSRLPLRVTLRDFNNTTEKIFYPEPELTTAGVAGGCAPVPGDITIYAPWGNVAIFCKSWSYSEDLIHVGHIEGDGIRVLQVAGDIEATLQVP